MWFSFLLSKRILLRGEKQCTCFSSYLTKPKTILDLDPYKEICSTQSNSKGLSLFLFQLLIRPTFIKRQRRQPSISSKTRRSFLLYSRQEGLSIYREVQFFQRRNDGAMVTLCVWESLKESFHVGAQWRSMQVTEGRKCLKCLKGKNKQFKNQFRGKWCDSWKNIQVQVRALTRFHGSMSAWSS